MENIDGALAFKSTLNIDDFNVSAEAMERRIRNMSTSITSESDRMAQSILDFARNGAKYIATYLVANGMGGLLNSIVQTRGQFQQLEIAFETMLGSGTKAQALMNQMIDTAARTPFDLAGVAGGAKQLLAYGFAAEEVNDTLVRLGNIASGLSIPLGDMVYLYGTTMTQGRLFAQDMRQFMGRGIPLAKELAAMYGKTTEEINEMVSAGKIGFADVEKVIMKMTNSGGQFYNLMEKQSSSLTGMIANLGDAWDMALNKLGQDNQDAFGAAISGATYLVEHLDDILRILKSIAIAYGTYKAAIVANTLVTKGYTGVALIDNTVRQAKIALMNADAKLSGQVSTQTAKMTAAQIAHTKSLEAQLTAQERAAVVNQLRVASIAQLLTAQQQEYLSNLGLTTSSVGYEAAAMEVLSVDQRQALSKLDLSSKSVLYRAAIEQEVMAKTRSKTATIELMREEVKAAYAKLESAKEDVSLYNSRVEMARYDLYWAKQSGDVRKIATAEKKMEADVENQSIARKTALAASTDFYTKKKQLETATVKGSTVATATDNVVKTAATTSTNILSAATLRLNIAVRSLWASMKANPIGWIVSLLGIAISVFTMLRNKNKEADDVVGEFNETTKKEIDNLNMLISVLKNTESGTRGHKNALDKVNAILKDYNKELLTEKSTVDDLNRKYKELTDAINESSAARIKAKYIEKIQQNQTGEQEDARKQLEKEAKRLKEFRSSPGSGNYGDTGGYSVDIKAIQNMNDAIYDQIEIMAVEAAERLKGLTGDAYTDGFGQSISNISKAVQAASGANDREMEIFQKNLTKYLSEIVKSEQDVDQKTKELTSSMDAFIGTVNKPSSTNSIDYITMAFGDLDKLVKETQSEIDAINNKSVKVDTDNEKLNELLEKLGQVKNAISAKELNLNTESGIEARIKQLKDERSDVEINSKRYKELSATIETLQKKVPNAKTANRLENADDQLTERKVQSEIRLEQARIDVMEDGYEKRKAITDLQHKQNLATIDKEERELKKARKDAGKSGLTADETADFQSRRDLEDKSYLKAQNKLFDDEISYKKERYQVYWRWVENMGIERANEQFAELIKGGESFKSYLEQQQTELNKKRATGSLSEGETNFLISINAQLDEINGVKSAMDQFKESMSKAINEASTLADKIRVVAEFKNKLETGQSGIVGADGKAEASLFVSEQEKSNDKEIQERLLKDFRTFEEQRLDIINEFRVLRMQKEVQASQELLDKVNKGEADAISAINAEMLKQSADWQNLFTNLDYLTASEIEKIVTNIEAKLADTNLKLNPVDYNALLNSLNEAKDRIVSANPFKVLGSSFDDYIAKLRDLKRAQEQNLSDEEILKFKISVNNAVKDIVKSIGAINDVVSAVGSSLSGVANSFGADKLASDITDITDLFGSVAQTGTGVAKIISGDIVGGIKDMVTGLANAVQIFSRMHDKKKEREIQSIQKNVDALTKAYKKLGEEIENAYSVDKAAMIEQENELLEEQIKATREQIKLEESKKKTDKQKVQDYYDFIEESERKIEQNSQYRRIEAIMGTDIKSAIDEFANAYADAWSKGEKAAGKSADVVKNLIKNSIIDMLKNKLKPEVEAFMTFLGDALKDGVLSISEEKMIAEWEKKLEGIADRELKGKEKWLLDKDEKSEDPLTGAVRGMSEQTGSIVAGKLNVVVINQGDQLNTLRESLLYQKQIEFNTRVSASELQEIKSTLKRIESKESSLLSQGIR